MNDKSKIIIGIFATAFSLFAWWVSDIPIGYYQFKKMCKEEGGLQSYLVVEPNVGWLAESEPSAEELVSSYQTVPFARFRANDGVWKDVRYKGGNPWWGSSYETIPAADGKRAQYSLVIDVEAVPSSIRLRKEVLTLGDESSGKVVFRSTRFIFTWTEPKNTILGMSGTTSCPSNKEEISSINSFLKIKD